MSNRGFASSSTGGSGSGGSAGSATKMDSISFIKAGLLGFAAGVCICSSSDMIQYKEGSSLTAHDYYSLRKQTLGSLVGMGGAFVLIPGLTGIMQLSQHQAHGR